MDRRAFVRTSSGALAASALLGCRVGGPKRRPNVLFIPVDDLRTELGCYGVSHVVSPNIDRLAESGMRFGQAHCQSALCNPSRASLLTGLRPDTIRVWDLQTDLRTTVPDAVTLPQHFRQNGYHTLGIGKVFHNIFPDPPSWDEGVFLDGFPFDPDAVYAGEEGLEIQARKRQALVDAGRGESAKDRFGYYYLKAVATEATDVPDNAYYDGAQTDWAVEKLSELAGREEPFFLAVGYYRPHLPFNAPKRYWDLYDRETIPLAENDFFPRSTPSMAINSMREVRGYTDFAHVKHPTEGSLTEEEARLLKHGYLASVSYTDAQVGRLLDALEEEGLAEDTLVILWGDHGWKLGEHNSWGKMTNFETDTRAPLLLRAPGQLRAGLSTERLVEFVDIYPTLCELCGLPVPPGLEGLSAVPLLSQPDRPWKTAVFSQYLRSGAWVGPDGAEYMGRTLRTERYRYGEWRLWEEERAAGGAWATVDPVAVELYDHATDPGENENLAGRPEHADRVVELRGRLAEGWRGELP
jgi:iduronate 2-sulfatase